MAPGTIPAASPVPAGLATMRLDSAIAIFPPGSDSAADGADIAETIANMPDFMTDRHDITR